MLVLHADETRNLSRPLDCTPIRTSTRTMKQLSNSMFTNKLAQKKASTEEEEKNTKITHEENETGGHASNKFTTDPNRTHRNKHVLIIILLPISWLLSCTCGIFKTKQKRKANKHETSPQPPRHSTSPPSRAYTPIYKPKRASVHACAHSTHSFGMSHFVSPVFVFLK